MFEIDQWQAKQKLKRQIELLSSAVGRSTGVCFVAVLEPFIASSKSAEFASEIWRWTV
jgi:hypothetical protein